jgi:hypothetical protein
MLTLFTTPVVYIYMDRAQSWLRRFLAKTPTQVQAPAHTD